MPREYAASQQPFNYVEAKSMWDNEGAKDKGPFFYEVREIKEFTVKDIEEFLAIIYHIRHEDYAAIKIKTVNERGIPLNIELELDPEISHKLFAHQVSFEFTVEGSLTDDTQSHRTNISRTDYYEDGSIWGESIADYRREVIDGADGAWVMQPDIMKANAR